MATVAAELIESLVAGRLTLKWDAPRPTLHAAGTRTAFKEVVQQECKQPGLNIAWDWQSATAVARQSKGALGQDHRPCRALAEPHSEAKQRLIV